MKYLLAMLCILAGSFAMGQNKDSVTSPKPNSSANAQPKGIGIGLKGGLNFANVTNASSINSSNQTGFMLGIFFAAPSKSIVSFRTELEFSRQGYNYHTNTSTGNVNLDYILLPQIVGINITHFVQLQVGFQMAFLINAKVDSSSQSSSNPYGAALDYYNRFDYGAAGGIEVYPFKGILVGARYNISFGQLYKTPSSGSATPPSFVPSVDAKNNVVQLYAGYRF